MKRLFDPIPLPSNLAWLQVVMGVALVVGVAFTSTTSPTRLSFSLLAVLLIAMGSSVLSRAQFPMMSVVLRIVALIAGLALLLSVAVSLFGRLV